MDGKNIKALFRRSQSHKALGEWSGALRDLDTLVNLGEATEQVKQDVKFCFTKYTDEKKAEAAKAQQEAATTAEAS